MLRAQDAGPGRDHSVERAPRINVRAHPRIQQAEVEGHDCGSVAIQAQTSFVDRAGSFVERPSRGELALRLEADRKIVQLNRESRVVGTERGFGDSQPSLTARSRSGKIFQLPVDQGETA